MPIKIVFPEGEPGEMKAVRGTKIFNAETGDEIKGIIRIEMDLSVDDILEAKITVAVSECENLDWVDTLVVEKLEKLEDWRK